MKRLKRFLCGLYRAAKEKLDRRFSSLHDKVCREDLLTFSCKTMPNRNTFPDDLTRPHLNAYIKKIQRYLLKGRYTPNPIQISKRPKESGSGYRIYKVPDIRDRIIQRAVAIVLTPIFEPDFSVCSFGGRIGHGVPHALLRIKECLENNSFYVIRLDLENFFYTIPHLPLATLLEKRLSDGWILGLLKSWIKQGEEEHGRRLGIGMPISPLLTNIFMTDFEKQWSIKLGNHVKLFRYVDDFLILTTTDPYGVLKLTGNMLEKFGLKINNGTKSPYIKNPGESFEYLGCRFISKVRYSLCRKWDIVPSNEARQKFIRKIGIIDIENLCPRTVPSQEVIQSLSRWLQYYDFERKIIIKGYPEALQCLMKRGF